MAGGDSKNGWPFPMKGNRYVPSFMSSTCVDEPGAEKASGVFHLPPNVNQLIRFDHGEGPQAKGNIFEGMLKALVMDNNQIKEATKFALDNSDSAGVIVEILTKSLTLKETPVRLKIARLLLVSNILYSRDPTYHNKFKSILPRVMFTFNELCCTIRENLVVGIVKERVLKVLQDWANWSLYSNEYLNILRDIFLGSGETRIVDATATNTNNNIDGGENLLGTEPTKAVDSIDNKAECNDANGGSQLTPHEKQRGEQ